MRLHRKLRDSLERGRDIDIDHLRDSADAVASTAQRGQHLLLSFEAVLDVFTDLRFGFANERSVAGQNQTDVEAEQPLQRFEVVRHITIGRPNHGCAVTEYIVTAEEHLVARLIKTTMTGFVAGRVEDMQFAFAE